MRDDEREVQLFFAGPGEEFKILLTNNRWALNFRRPKKSATTLGSKGSIELGVPMRPWYPKSPPGIFFFHERPSYSS